MNPEPSSYKKKGSKVVFYDDRDQEILSLPADKIVAITSPEDIEGYDGAIFLIKADYFYVYSYDGELIGKRKLGLFEKMIGPDFINWYKSIAR
ncbi:MULTISPECIES: hypothetical protein [Campylobacter]|uniref:hypothetical protein n=1 Tax=Campylobacter TaxID=194 RepID=UPI000A33F0E7|nr:MULTISPECIES: hypothetical protein [unclassified Campylobacter]